MPAGSEPPVLQPQLPHTFRPFGVRIAILTLGTLLLVVVAAIWIALPAHIRAQFTAFQIGTIFVIGGLFYSVGFALARSRVVARDEGITVVNGYRSRRLEWTEVLKVSLRPGSPWGILDLSDGTTLAVMGIQGSDGPRAKQQARDLQRLVDLLSAPR